MTALWRGLRSAGPDAVLLRTGFTHRAPDVVRLCTALGVVVETVRGVTWAGQLDRTAAIPVIRIRDRGEAVERHRFTLAHELGHLMRHDEPIHVDDPSHPGWSRDPSEQEANQFAAALLMPMCFLRSDTIEMRQHADPIGWMARVHRVSRPAVTYRLRNLGVSV